LLRRRGIALAVLAGLALPAAGGRGAEAPLIDRFDTVVIDAGHGGDDHGARGPRGLVEKDLVLDVARRLAARLRRGGLRVVMTRSDDRFVPLEERTAIANDARGDLFLSIHANAARDTDVRGIETFFLSLKASDDAAQRVAERENQAFRVPA
jgi:N-acetylmuramoyl-L-alanine amidase